MLQRFYFSYWIHVQLKQFPTPFDTMFKGFMVAGSNQDSSHNNGFWSVNYTQGLKYPLLYVENGVYQPLTTFLRW